MRHLELIVTKFTGPRQWQWSLFENGQELARHAVTVADAEWRLPAFADLFGHLDWRTTPAGRRRVEPAVTRELGEWAAEHLLGDLVDHLGEPATVEVLLPRSAVEVGLLPLEAVVVGDDTLASARVTFIWHVCSDGPHEPPPGKRSPSDPLRVLAVFSLPDGETALALRRERVALTRLVERAGGDIELRILQYGTTRETFQEACSVKPGWDLVHISGHGAATGIILERPDSTPDPVASEDLIRLMAPLRDRVSVITLSACGSAAESGDASLARSVADRLDCAVMAMRFPVGDEFAADLVLGVYGDMIVERRHLSAALGMTLNRLSAEAGRRSKLSISTPTLFGCRTASATAHTTRPGTPVRRPHNGGPAPDRFVGRVGVLARARGALAIGSAVPGVVFHGMTGTGKTTCARELVDISAGEFDTLVWHTVPPAADPAVALVGFAEALDGHSPGLGLRASIGGDDFAMALSRVAEWCRRSRVLTVIDDAQPLLDSDGGWQTSQWAGLTAALTPAGADSRLVITSRTPIAGECQTCVVDPLSRGESLLLIRELPRLGDLLNQRSPESMRLVARLLDVAQGHPAVLELADAQVAAGRPESLQAVLDSIEAGDRHYPAVLVEWTEQAMRSLTSQQQRLFYFLCCLEEADRQDLIAASGPMDWNVSWRETGGDGDIEELLPALLAAALVVPTRGASAIHPTVVSHARARNPAYVADVSERAAGSWGGLFVNGMWAGRSSEVLTLAAWRGLPYSARIQDVFRLQVFADYILREDHSRATTIMLRSLLAPAAAWTMSPQSGRIMDYLLAKVQRGAAPDSVEIMASVIERAQAAGDHEVVSSMSAELFEQLFRQGDLDRAEALTDAMIKASASAGSVRGQLNSVIAERFRIDVLNRQGRYPEAMTAGTALLDRIQQLAEAGSTGTAEALGYLSGQRKRLLQALASAAGGLRRWDLALDHDLSQIDELRNRGASAQDVAEVVYNTYIPLMELGRLDEAAAAIALARHQFEQTGSPADLGRALSASGEIEIRRGNQTLGMDLVAEGLRHSYRQPDPDNIAIMHGVYGEVAFQLARHDLAVAHLAAGAALLLHLDSARATGMLLRLDRALAAGGKFAGDEAAIATLGPPLNSGFDALARQIGLTPSALADACRVAGQIGGELPVQLRAIWDPILSAVAATARGILLAELLLSRALAEQETNPDWNFVVSSIRTMLQGGDRPPGGDAIESLLLDRARAAWAGQPVVRPNLWGAVPFRELLGTMAVGLLSNHGAAERVASRLEKSDLAALPVFKALHRLMSGERDRDVLTFGLDPMAVDVVETMLDYVR